jgi:hypothetical protein
VGTVRWVIYAWYMADQRTFKSHRGPRSDDTSEQSRSSESPTSGVMTPAELARDLGISPKTLRAWLRSRIERGASKGTPWGQLDDRIVDAAHKRWGTSRLQAASRVDDPSSVRVAAPAGGKRDRDQDYVTNLCDEVLGERARREHRFDWLRGDSGEDGRARALPVDAFYPEHGLVVEYRERQHAEPVPHFDKPHVLTVSGVHRGEQRRIYDLRREREIPKHGLRLCHHPLRRS